MLAAVRLGDASSPTSGLVIVSNAPVATHLHAGWFDEGIDWVEEIQKIIQELIDILDGKDPPPPPDEPDTPDEPQESWFYDTHVEAAGLVDEYVTNTDPSSPSPSPEWTAEQWSDDVWLFIHEVLYIVDGEYISEPEPEQQEDADFILDMLDEMFVILTEDF